MVTGRPDPREKKTAKLRDKIKAGSIIFLYCDFISNPKNKYIVFAHVDFDNEESFIFIVNSEIRPFIEHDAHLKAGQILLSKEPNYQFLDHDSYVNCVEPFDCLDLDFMVSHLLENPKDYLGELAKEEKNNIVSYIKIAQTIGKVDKEIIINSLKE